MSEADSFFDTSVLLYLLSGDPTRSDRVEGLLSARGVISVQVLNEFASVALRKLKMPLPDVREVLATIQGVCTVEPMTVATHDRGLAVYERYGFSFHDSVMVGAALIAGARILYTEDLQHGQIIDGHLRVANPFHDR